MPKECCFVIGVAVMLGFSLMIFIDETFKIIKQRRVLAQLEERPNPHDQEMESLLSMHRSENKSSPDEDKGS